MAALGSLIILMMVILHSPLASAVTLRIDMNGILFGAENVIIDGTNYDVRFLNTTCIVAYPDCSRQADFTFRTLAQARMASEALGSQVFLGRFDSNVRLTQGCTDFFAIRCLALTPYAFFGGGSPIIRNSGFSNGPGVGTLGDRITPVGFDQGLWSSRDDSVVCCTVVWAAIVLCPLLAFISCLLVV